MAGSASRWALALFWSADRSPGVQESLAKDALGVFSRCRRSSTGRAPAFSSLQSSSTAPCAVVRSLLWHFTMLEMRATRAMGQLVVAGSASGWALALFWTAERSPGV